MKKNLIKILLISFVCLKFLCLPYTSWGQGPKDTLNLNPNFILYYFLNVDCVSRPEGEDLPEVLTNFFKFRSTLEPKLIEVFRFGPPKEIVEDYKRIVGKRWAQQEAFLNTNPELGLSQENLAILRKANKTQYINEKLDKFKLRYKERATIGLIAMDSFDGQTVINETLQSLQHKNRKNQNDIRLESIIQKTLKRFSQ